MPADTLGRPLRFGITAGQVHDVTAAIDLLEGQKASAILADMKGEAVIPSKRNRKVLIPHDTAIYKHRNQIERCFGRLKHFRRFTTRYDRRTIHFTGFVHLAAAMICPR